MWKSFLLIAFAAALLSGCTDSAAVRTSPPGAAVVIDDQPPCISPCAVYIPRDQIDEPHTWRVHLDGYRAAEGEFRRRVSAGRIVGYIFTAGILYIFKKPSYIEPASVVLERVNVPTVGEATGSGSTEERLLKLKALYDKGLLTPAEYDRYRDEAIRGGM